MIRALAVLAAAWLGTAVVFLALDAAWLTTTNAALYRPALAPLLAPAVRPVPAVLFYLIYLTGLVIFAVRPALADVAGWAGAARRGALFGLVAYATYDLTNQATLAVWPTRITLADLAWGALVSATAAASGALAGRTMGRRPLR
ncbi:DUF2177 family protein [Caulobacter sp. KR2-114]|uniref:DUF2177 family protein n=1 Tax=Caulobacter sp. KR2-114 TaxID=3400912 RepID=UPI003C1001D6